MQRGRSNARARTALVSVVAGACVAGIVGVAISAALVVLPAVPASAATSSAVTVTAAEQDDHLDTAPFPDLAVTVSATTDLVAQGITVSWTGGTKSSTPSTSSGGSDFLQVFQCWGDDPDDPTRPDRTTCQYGGVNTVGAQRDSSRTIDIADVPEQDLPYTVPKVSSIIPAYTSIPFVARDGTVVSSVTTATDGTKTRDSTVEINSNQYFTKYTTNEVSWAGTGPDGTGSIAFELQTAAQSPGLGCGAAVEDGAGGEVGASCWLVILPRGTADNGATVINQSGLFWDSWQHAIAVKLDFRRIGSRCAEGTAERQLAGSELATLAVNSWQPVVCAQDGGAVYSLIANPESDSLASANTVEDAPLALSSLPLGAAAVDALTYAPIALTGVTVVFAIDRAPDPFDDVPDDIEALATLPFTSLNLTPRLLAKLLTNSYTGSLPTGADAAHLGAANPENITQDPDFLEVNDPEWRYQLLTSAAIADVIVPQGRSDAATAVWRYIMADDDAVAFLAGTPDPWGMVVNPWSSTDATVNRSGTGLTLPRDNFPKADPVTVDPPEAGEINLVTWRPYATDLDTVAYLTLRGDGQTLGDWQPNATPPKYGKAGRSLPGYQRVLGLTDTASAARYEVRTAALLNPAGEFVGPTVDAMTAAAAAMTATGGAGTVLGFDPASETAAAATAAYPLTMPVYAATNPTLLSAALRTDYAAFIRYAVTDGQTSGDDLGELPAGYAPISSAWRAQALAAADVIQAGGTPAASTPTATASTPSSSIATGATTVESTAPTNPAATGEATGALTGPVTPDDPGGSIGAAALPISLASGAIAALAVPIVSRRRQR